MVVWSIPRYSLISIVVFKFWETLALSSKRIVKALNHIIYSTLVLACRRNSRVEVCRMKLNPSSACFLLLKFEKKLFYCFFLFDYGSISIYISTMSLRWIIVYFSVGAFAYRNKNFVKSKIQYRIWNYREKIIPVEAVSFFKYPWVTF